MFSSSSRPFGRLHKALVDTIFKYNNRHAKGRYLAALAGTRPMQPGHAGAAGQLGLSSEPAGSSMGPWSSTPRSTAACHSSRSALLKR